MEIIKINHHVSIRDFVIVAVGINVFCDVDGLEA